MAIRVGCGSWSDNEYAGLLFPRGTPAQERLRAYAQWFDYVEVNASYYRTPRKETVENWVRETPPDFIFDLKLHRNLLSSISKPAASPAERRKGTKSNAASARLEKDLLAFMLEQLQPLIRAKKLGTFLLLLPPRFAPEKNGLEQLDVLVERIKPYRLAVELRNSAWVRGPNRERTLAYFRERGITWVSVDMPRLKHPSIVPPIDEVAQPGLAYLRLHGRNKAYLDAKSAEEKHTYLYNARALRDVLVRVGKLASQAAEVRIVANNHAQDYAPRTALEIKRMLGQPVPAPLPFA